MPTAIQNLVLHLDLAAPQVVPDDQIRAALPAGDPEPVWLRATEYGAKPTADGSPVGNDGKRSSWRPFLAAIDHMLAAAADYLPGRVWITGRGGLPAFFYLGRHRQFADLTFLHAPAARDNVGVGMLHLRLDAQAGPTPYFAPLATRRVAVPGTVALAVRTRRQPVDLDQVRADLHGDRRFAVDVLDLVGADRLDEDSFGNARDQLREALVRMGQDYPNRSDLAMLLAGPTHLAFLAGAMTVANTHPRVTIYEQAERGSGRYRPAFVLPRSTGIPGPHTVLCLETTPLDRARLQTNAEVRDIMGAVRGTHLSEIQSVMYGAAGRSFSVKFEPAMRIPDLGDGLRRYRPRIVHLGAHGRPDGILAEDAAGFTETFPVDALVEIMVTAGDMVELVVLSACDSSAAAARLAERGTTAIGFDGKLDDRAVLTFSRTLYAELACGRSVAAAFASANAEFSCKALMGTPRLCVPEGMDANRHSFDPVH